MYQDKQGGNMKTLNELIDEISQLELKACILDSKSLSPQNDYKKWLTNRKVEFEVWYKIRELRHQAAQIILNNDLTYIALKGKETGLF
jgi:hypothetical protein